MAPSVGLMKACNGNTTLSVPILQSRTNPSSSSSSCVFFTKSIIKLTLHSSNSGHNNHHSNNNFPLLSFPRCSSKPDTSTDSDLENIPKGSSSSSEPTSLVSKPQKASKLDSNNSSGSLTASPEKSSSSSSSSSPSRGLVFGLGPSDSWDGAEVGSPVVKRFLSDHEERWFMWYHGRPNNGSDWGGLATSSNGVHWKRGSDSARSSIGVGYVLKCGKEWWEFDTKGIRPSEVLMMCSSWVSASNAAYWLYYTGYTNETVNIISENPCLHLKLFKSLPGLAVSNDGRHWARVEGEHHSGALFGVGEERDWDSLFISCPRVVCHGNSDFRMYYHSFDAEKGHFGIGLARSRDGIRWVKLGKIMGGSGKVGSFDEFGVMNACVARNLRDGKYVMAYEGVGGDGRRSIGVAVSDDGLMDWVRVQDEAVLKPSEIGCWDDECVGSPCLVQIMDRGRNNNDEWRLYYRGVGNGGRGGIGMAVGDITDFRRWKGFHA
ncbi:hypothetical protein PIB30_008787 [Stylosanthes scabra]|uniref:Glycosyl hydrolase, five-bladed beta-propellor domain-containing protein n=1 Tax=Stylosanthes scabra TaxID=79078 RepID=A0ABU6W4F1_9FABA|nr:hypothetical protein [Stylosanthes scabra]